MRLPMECLGHFSYGASTGFCFGTRAEKKRLRGVLPQEVLMKLLYLGYPILGWRGSIPRSLP